MATGNGYIWSFWLYCGAESGKSNETKSVVMDFVNELESLPFFIITDSYYGSLELAEELHKKQIFFVLSCQKNRPAFLFSKGMHKEKKVKKGESRWCSNGQLAAIYFKDRSKVNFLTNADIIGEDKESDLPKVVSIYRKHMGHVDRADRILSLCKNNHKNRKWTDAHWKTCFKMTVDNSWILFRAVKKENISLENFIMNLALEIVNQYSELSTDIIESVGEIGLSMLHVPVRSNRKNYCEFCKPKKNHSSSNFYCYGCNYFLHFDCFAPFHGINTEK